MSNSYFLLAQAESVELKLELQVVISTLQFFRLRQSFFSNLKCLKATIRLFYYHYKKLTSARPDLSHVYSGHNDKSFHRIQFNTLP